MLKGWFSTMVLSWAVLMAGTNELTRAAEAEDTIPVIPRPAEMYVEKGSFTITPKTPILVEKGNKRLAEAAEYLTGRLSAVMGTAIKATETTKTTAVKGAILLTTVDADAKLGDEGYGLSSADGAVVIRASKAHGVFYGIQTLLQLLPPQVYADKKVAGVTWTLPAVTIKDTPRFKWRGLHLDVCRHFYNVDEVKKYIDLLAMHKMNTFHWHLTEDQGWRIEIKKYPKLSTISAKRAQTPIPANRRKGDGKPYGPHIYTQDEVKDVVEYARKRFITVVPEIELPGHSLAALAAYPELGCFGDKKKYKVATRWGVFSDVYCAGNEKTFQFLQDVFDEILPLFPSKYIHIGGDECPKGSWKKCPKCQARIKAEGLKNEHELQSYFIKRMEKYLNSKGRQIIGWDEILEGGLAPNAAVMSWRGEKGGIHAAKSKHYVVMSPNSHCYLDHYQAADKSSEPPAIGGYLPLHKVYSYNPVPKSLTKEEGKYILGVQGNVWSEYIPTFAQVEYMAYPRGCALAEVGWTQPAKKDYKRFQGRLVKHLKRLDAMNVNYRKLGGDTAKSAKPAKAKMPCSIKTTLPTHKGNTPVRAFDGKNKSVFWSSRPVRNADTFVIYFKAPKAFKEVTAITGKPQGGGDILKKGVLEVSKDGKIFTQIAEFKNGKATGKVAGKIKAIRIRATAPQEEWLIIQEVQTK